jgi:hypothetical protein
MFIVGATLAVILIKGVILFGLSVVFAMGARIAGSLS